MLFQPVNSKEIHDALFHEFNRLNYLAHKKVGSSTRPLSRAEVDEINRVDAMKTIWCNELKPALVNQTRPTSDEIDEYLGQLQMITNSLTNDNLRMAAEDLVMIVKEGFRITQLIWASRRTKAV